MKNYEVYSTDSFNKLFYALDRDEQDWINKIKDQLEFQVTGKPLQFTWFREKKYLNKRLYFLVDENAKRLLFVSFASKKDQQKIIDFVIKNRDNFFELLRTF
ncbi:hypothetical protein CMI42_03985 [Candidatus Pacearchaeota archaeon]|nr:hypothetical protein [Candidatus Pacearchaeota archaeon]|tara:strand:+ start:3381 stop:3686 length:306 start_codon:yes stop_codon:yes gene_type:complete